MEGKRFLLQNTSETYDMLIFATDDSLKRLANCKTLYMDGTFKTCPELYKQYFSVHELFKKHVRLLVFVLLLYKIAATYYRLFHVTREAVFNLGGVLDPKVIMPDFESGLIEAVRSQFPAMES